MKNFLKYIIEIIFNALMCSTKKTVRAIAWFDRKVVKRYLGLETPMYKLWWKCNMENLQNKINNQVKQ